MIPGGRYQEARVSLETPLRLSRVGVGVACTALSPLSTSKTTGLWILPAHNAPDSKIPRADTTRVIDYQCTVQGQGRCMAYMHAWIYILWPKYRQIRVHRLSLITEPGIIVCHRQHVDREARRHHRASSEHQLRKHQRQGRRRE